MSRTYSTPVASKSAAHENRTFFCVDWKTENSTATVGFKHAMKPHSLRACHLLSLARQVLVGIDYVRE